MKQKLNHKGFTLVEIVVVLLIVTIVMALAGTMILSSFNLFGDSTQEDVSKRALDKVAEYVKGELEYANDIRITNIKPDGDNWSYLDIVNGHLVQNDTVSDITKEYSVYSDSFYYDNRLEMSLSNFVNSDQFDILYTFKKSNETYEVNHTLKFSNLTLKYKKDNTYKPFDGLTDSYLVSSNEVKIYYIRGNNKTVIEEPKPVVATGTVADQIAFLNNYNNREMWIAERIYRRGDMVFIDGYWWYCLVDDLGKASSFYDAKTAWKKIDAYYDSKSGYQRGDIIIYNNKYYRCKVDIIRDWNPTPGENSTYWELIEDEETVKNTTYTNSYQIKITTVRNELNSMNRVSLYKSGTTYKKNEIVKVYRDGYEKDDNLAMYFKCVADETSDNPVKNTNYDWKYLSIEFNSKSAYNISDKVYYTWVDGFYIRADVEVRKETTPADEIFNTSYPEVHWALVKD